jgi:hypothetical protein
MADPLAEGAGQRQASGLPAWDRTAMEERLAVKAGKVSRRLGGSGPAKTGGISGEES